MKLSTVGLTVALLGLGSGAALQAQKTQEAPAGSLMHLSLEELGNVKVTTATKEPEQVWNTAAAIYVITQEDIRRSGATTIPEALRLAPGVEVARIDSDHWAVGVRGFGGEFSKSLLVLIDGRSVYSPLFAGVYWQVQDTLLEDIDRIEVIRGPGGTIWGSNAVNGVINIITKSAADTHGKLETLGGGNVDQGAGGSRYGGSKGSLNYRMYGKGFIRGAEFHPDGKNFDEWKMGQLGFRTDWTPTSRDAWTFQGDMYLGRDGERVDETLYSPPSSMVVDAPHHTSGGNLLAHWRRQLSHGSDLEVQGYFDRTTRFSPQMDETRNTFDLDLMYHLGALPHQDLLLGVGARWSPDKIGQKYATLNFTPPQETDSIYSWFAQDQIRIVPQHLSLTVGSKFEHNNRSGFDVQPNARLLWTPTEHQSAWIGITRALRTPSRLDQDLQLTDFLTATPVPVFLRVVGTPTFKPERLLGTEIGYRTLLRKRLYGDVAIFRNDYNDLYGYGTGTVNLELTPTPARLVLQEPLSNALKGDTSGGELAMDWRPLDWWEWKGSYSYLHLYVHDKPGFTDTQNTTSDNGSSPHHQVRLESRMNLPGGFELDPAYRYVSALPAQTVKAYHTADLRFGWRKAGWDLSVDGQNLFQPHHAEFGSDVNTIVGIKRAVYAKITWTSAR
jgi:iron complex outermembrane receptor protein